MLVPLRHASDFLSGHGMQLAESGHGEPLPQSTAALFIGISAVLVALSGLMSGLTISLLAMDEIEMELLENHHLLLCTLVVWNAFSMEALPIFLDRLADPFTAVLLSVTVVLFFGVLPDLLSNRCQAGARGAALCTVAGATSMAPALGLTWDARSGRILRNL